MDERNTTKRFSTPHRNSYGYVAASTGETTNERGMWSVSLTFNHKGQGRQRKREVTNKKECIVVMLIRLQMRQGGKTKIAAVGISDMFEHIDV